MLHCRPTSAAAIISLLDEDQHPLREFAIRKLNEIVDEFWFEIAGSIQTIEMCSETEEFGERKLSSLLASKLHYHLGSYDAALRHTLGAGELLFECQNTEFLNTMIDRCIENYKRERQIHGCRVDPRIKFIVDKAFEKCFRERQYSYAIGLALETRRMDVLEKAIINCEDTSSVLEHTFKLIINLFDNESVRKPMLQSLAHIYKRLWNTDVINICKCHRYLEDQAAIVRALDNLLRGNDDDALLAYQICFDLYENASRTLLDNVCKGIRNDKPNRRRRRARFKSRLRNVYSILNGNITTELYLDFLVRNNHTDYLILENTKKAVQDPICYTAVIIANALMNCGTKSDRFVVDNIEWLFQETNWAQFSAIAGLGVINKGHEQDSIGTMSSYFKDGLRSKGIFSKAGFLYGLGLLHANHGEMIIDYLIDQLQSARNLEVIHGCCLGIGLAALGTNRQDINELLKVKLGQNEATIGESVGIAMGLVSMGSNSACVVKEMLDFARDTQHEKIIRGLAVGIALIMFGQMEKADLIVDTLWNDKNPFLRCAAMHTLAMAYCGTSDNKVTRRLLAAAVNDSDNDVRRTAIQALGFIYLADSSKCVSAVSLLAESYNLHTRCGAAVALGISCAGSGNNEALSLLWNLSNDVENLVLQGALISSAMILIQHASYTSPKVNDFQSLYKEIIEDKLEKEIAKFGAILAQGIMNAGGRNVTISLKSRDGQTNMGAVAGMLVFTQCWYWFPLIHFLSLTFLPTCLIGVNAELQMPQMEFTSNSKPSNFRYPPPTKRRKIREDNEIIPFMLSYATRIKAQDIQEIRIEKDQGSEEKKKEVGNEENQSEAEFEVISNPSRVTAHQMKYVQIPEGSRYEAVKSITEGGIVVMRDKEKGKPEVLLTPVILDIEAQTI